MQSQNNTQNEKNNETSAADTNSAESQATKNADKAEQQPDWQTLAKEAEQKYLYLYADFENYKKRAQKEREDLLRYSFDTPANELLPAIDNLERSLQFAKPDTDANLIMGLKMVLQQFQAAFEKLGVTAITSTGTQFDPNFHEAVEKQASDLPENTIISEQLKGYKIHGRLLRAARVVVSSGSNDSSNTTQ